jgi:hypothetical protein
LPIDRNVALPVTQKKGTRQLRNNTFSQFHGRTRNLMAAKRKDSNRGKPNVNSSVTATPVCYTHQQYYLTVRSE